MSRLMYTTTKNKKGLYTTNLFRFLQSDTYYGNIILQPFIDEKYKITTAKWKICGIIKGYLADNFVYRLDKRSIRYGKRFKVIENKKHYHRYPKQRGES